MFLFPFSLFQKTSDTDDAEKNNLQIFESSTPSPTPAVVLDQRPQPNMVFCFTDNGKTFRLRTGFRGRIELKGNATTGYSWRTQRIHGDSIQMEKWVYTPDPTFLIGSGGTFTADFVVVGEGRSYIYLVYDSPFYPRTIGYNFVLIIDGTR